LAGSFGRSGAVNLPQLVAILPILLVLVAEMTEFLTWIDSSENEHALEAEFVIDPWTDSRKGEISQVPIEDGSEIADHYIQHPDKLSVTVTVTNQPMSEGFARWEQRTIKPRESDFNPHGLLALTEAIGGLIGGLFGAAGLNETKVWLRFHKDDGKDYIGDFHDTLVKIKESVSLCSLTFRAAGANAGRVLDNLCLTDVTLTFSAETDAGKFGLEFTRIKKATLKAATLPKPSALLAKAPKTKIPGRNTATQDEEDALKYSKGKSLGAAAVDALPGANA
jgi:hypothetical protein